MPKPKLPIPPIQEANSYLWLALASCLKGDSAEAKAFAHNAAHIIEKTPLNELFTVFGDYLDVQVKVRCSRPHDFQGVLYLNNNLYQALLWVTQATQKFLEEGITEYDVEPLINELDFLRERLLDRL